MQDARNATLEDLAGILKSQHARKLDVVAPASSLRVRNGTLTVKGSEPQITDDGVTTMDGQYRPTEVFDEGLARTFNIPTGYLKRLRTEALDLYDANINGWLHGRTRRGAGQEEPEVLRSPDSRSFLVRCLRADEDNDGVARAILSDRYQLVDNLDVLTATLDGIKESGIEAIPVTCDLTDRRMHVRVAAPGVQAVADTLLAGYRSPFDDPDVNRERGDGARRWENIGGDGTPHVFAGFDIRNSETGDGAFTLVPVVTISTCRNGLTLTQEAYRKVHLGRKMDEGNINWSDDTQRKNLELVRARTRDAVATFLDQGWLERQVAELERQAGARVENADKAIRTVGKTLQYNESEINGVLDHFIRGGQLTAGGVANAVTSYAQTVDNADRAHDLEDTAVRALELAAR